MNKRLLLQFILPAEFRLNNLWVPFKELAFETARCLCMSHQEEGIITNGRGWVILSVLFVLILLMFLTISWIKIKFVTVTNDRRLRETVSICSLVCPGIL